MTFPKFIFIPALIFSFICLLNKPSFAQPPDNSGAELYKFWCSTCHGDQGQGLTDEWRATWPLEEQNCWQSKCHAANHPPSGFVFPKVVPAVIGPNALLRFDTTEALHNYIQTQMPYWNPDSLSEEAYINISTFIIEANYSRRGEPLNLSSNQTIFSLPLHPSQEKAPPTQDYDYIEHLKENDENKLSPSSGIFIIIIVSLLSLKLIGWANKFTPDV